MSKRDKDDEYAHLAESRHLQELQAIGYNQDTLKPLQRLENYMHKTAEDACNGIITDQEYETAQMAAELEIKRLFNKPLEGFFINGDPRGYALKLKDVKYEDRVISYVDMGGYQILSPEFN